MQMTSATIALIAGIQARITGSLSMKDRTGTYAYLLSFIAAHHDREHIEMRTHCGASTSAPLEWEAIFREAEEKKIQQTKVPAWCSHTLGCNVFFALGTDPTC